MCIRDRDEALYIVMDYIEGISLSELLKQQGAIGETAVKEWGIQLCEVLHYLHTRTPAIIYRDMKPSNIMVRRDGTLVLVDFGIAREYKEDANTDTIIALTQGYAAPEQYMSLGQSDARTDCLLYTSFHLR